MKISKDQERRCLDIAILFEYLIVIVLSITLSIPCAAYDLEERVQKTILDNGLKVLVVERHESPTVSLFITHRVGAVDESSCETGTAHFLEHLMFKGTRSIGTVDYEKEMEYLEHIRVVGNEIDNELKRGHNEDNERLKSLKKELQELQDKERTLVRANAIDTIYTENGGLDLNAATGYDQTMYHVSLPSNKVELWAMIESDRMTCPVFREFYSEREVIMEERRQMIESDPERKLMEQFLATAFMVHPYRRPVIGWASDMRVLNFDRVGQFFRTFYAPNNTVIVAVGDVKNDEFISLVRKYFGPIPSQDLPIEYVPEEPEQTGERQLTLRTDANPQLIVGYHKPTLPSFDDYVFDVIHIVVSEGRTSRLYQELVQEKQLAHQVSTWNGMPGARYSNLFTISATPRQPYTNKDVENALYAILEKLKSKPISDKELQKAKNILAAGFLRGLSSNRGLAHMLSYFETVAGDYRYITRHAAMVEKVTKQDIMDAARKYFTSENRTVAVIEKEGVE